MEITRGSALPVDLINLIAFSMRSARSSCARSEVEGDKVRYVPLSAITPNRKQPRQVFRQEALNELTADMLMVLGLSTDTQQM